MRMPLSRAEAVAEKIVAALEPFCERIEIVGSIRLRRPDVGDIDLVILPKACQLDAIKVRCSSPGITVLTNGSQNFLFVWNGIQVDIFFARPDESDLLDMRPGNFASLLMCRTGSKQHNIWFCRKALEHGCCWDPYQGVYRGKELLPCETERDLYQAIGQDYIKPEARER